MHFVRITRKFVPFLIGLAALLLTTALSASAAGRPSFGTVSMLGVDVVDATTLTVRGAAVARSANSTWWIERGPTAASTEWVGATNPVEWSTLGGGASPVQGSLLSTGVETDVAIQGAGFFRGATGDHPDWDSDVLTRAGHLHWEEPFPGGDLLLQTAGGRNVVGFVDAVANGVPGDPFDLDLDAVDVIRLSPWDSDVQIGPDGSVSAVRHSLRWDDPLDGTRQVIAVLAIVAVEDPSRLRSAGDHEFRLRERQEHRVAVPGQDDGVGSLAVGYLESLPEPQPDPEQLTQLSADVARWAVGPTCVRIVMSTQVNVARTAATCIPAPSQTEGGPTVPTAPAAPTLGLTGSSAAQPAAAASIVPTPVAVLPKALPRALGRVATSWNVRDGRTMLTRAQFVGLPAGSRVTVSCRGGGCPAPARQQPAVTFARAAATLSRASLRPGAVVTFRIQHAGRSAREFVFTMRRSLTPRLG